MLRKEAKEASFQYSIFLQGKDTVADLLRKLNRKRVKVLSTTVIKRERKSHSRIFSSWDLAGHLMQATRLTHLLRLELLTRLKHNS